MKLKSSFVLWFTGLPCSGKTTLAKRMYTLLNNHEIAIEHLDGDTLRDVFQNTGFSRQERNTHIRQVAFWTSKLEHHGVCVLASFVSPYQESREFARNSCKNFIEVFVSTPLEECERRDVKGMYAKARSGEISNFTGIDDPYEPPQNPDIEIDTSSRNIDDCLSLIISHLVSLDLLAQEPQDKPSN